MIIKKCNENLVFYSNFHAKICTLFASDIKALLCIEKMLMNQNIILKLLINLTIENIPIS